MASHRWNAQDAVASEPLAGRVDGRRTVTSYGTFAMPFAPVRTALHEASAGVAVDLPGMPTHVISIHASAPARVSLTCDGQTQRRLQHRGDTDIIPADMPVSFMDEEECSALVLFVPTTLLESTADELGISPGLATLSPRFQFRDARMEHIAWALRSGEDGGAECNRLAMDSLSTALSAHLLSRYAPGLPALPPGLSKPRYRRVTEYIDAHLDRELSLAELAAVAGFSLSHFKLLFRRTSGFPVHRYVVRRRVERARQLLLDGELPMRDVALAAGFAHQSHMARCMREMLGTTPTKLRHDRA